LQNRPVLWGNLWGNSAARGLDFGQQEGCTRDDSQFTFCYKTQRIVARTDEPGFLGVVDS
jgi:hypothetical protein